MDKPAPETFKLALQHKRLGLWMAIALLGILMGDWIDPDALSETEPGEVALSFLLILISLAPILYYTIQLSHHSHMHVLLKLLLFLVPLELPFNHC